MAFPELARAFNPLRLKLDAYLSSISQSLKDVPSFDTIPGITRLLSGKVQPQLQAFLQSDLLEFLAANSAEQQEQCQLKDKLKLDFFGFKQEKKMKMALEAKSGIQASCRKILELNRNAADRLEGSVEKSVLRKMKVEVFDDNKGKIERLAKLAEEDVQKLKNLFKDLVGKCNSEINELMFFY